MSAKTVSRASGRSSVGAAAYRDGIKIKNERDGIVHDYTRRDGVEDNFIIQPDGIEWATSPEKLWNAVEFKETRKNSTTAREYEISLPNELDAKQRKELAQEFAQHVVNKYGVIADIAIHAPTKDGDERNYHAHILTTTRIATQNGLGDKTRILDGRIKGSQEIENLRKKWAEMVNSKLEQNQINQRIDHRSYERQGIEQKPQEHMGWRATHAERGNIKKQLKLNPEANKKDIKPITIRGQRNEAIKQDNIALVIANKAIEEAKIALKNAKELVNKLKDEIKQTALNVTHKIQEPKKLDMSFFEQLDKEIKEKQSPEIKPEVKEDNKLDLSFIDKLDKEQKNKKQEQVRTFTRPKKYGYQNPYSSKQIKKKGRNR